MENSFILICDEDVGYARAFSSFIVTHIPNVRVKVLTNVSDFIRSMSVETYQIGMFTKPFLDLLGESKFKVKKIVCLYESSVEDEYIDLPSIYKFQSMDVTIESVKRLLESGNIRQKKEKTVFQMIFSPCRHELSLPFALALSEIYSEQESVLFVDMDEMSILPELLERDGDKNILDLIQRLQRWDGRIDIEEYCESLLGFSYIRPVFCPGVFSEIDGDIFEDFMEKLSGWPFERVVFLLGQGVNKLPQIFEKMDELVLLTKQGDYYKKSQVEFLSWCQGAGFEERISIVELPMSAGNLIDGAYKIEELIQGHLGIFARRFLSGSQTEEECQWTA